MHNEMKLLAGPKVDINQIRWPKAADFKGNVKNIMFDMEVIQHKYKAARNIEFGLAGGIDIDGVLHNFGPRGEGGAVGFDALRNIGVAGAMHEVWDKWQLNQQFGRGLRDHDKLAVKACNFFDARPREFEGVVCHGDMVDKMPKVADRFIKMKVPKDRNGNIEHGRFKLDGIKNIRIMPDMHFDMHPIHHIKPRTVKANPVAALKAFWKDAQKPKPGIGYGHPALKGLIHGREHRPCVAGFERFERPISINRGMVAGGVGGLWENWNAMFKPVVDPEQVKRMHAEEQRLLAEREAYRQEADRKRKLKTEKIYNQLANDMLQGLNKPGVDVTKQIAWYFSEVRYYGHGRMHTAVQICAERLKGQGFTYLGEGCWSSAFLAPDGWVYKVNCNSDSLDGWFAYAVNVKMNGNSKNFPNIDTITRIGGTYCAKIERLEPLTDVEQTEFRERNLGKMQAFRNSELSTIKREFGCTGDDAINLFEVVRDTYNEINGTYDIHPGNVMWRVDNDVKTLVLTDPLCGGNFSMDTMSAKLAA